MRDLMLGDILALGRRSSAELRCWLNASDPRVAARLACEAERSGETEAQFLRVAVSDFAAEADEEAWATLISAVREAGDPGAACVAQMIAFRLRLESVS
jgi:hypothetical protein